MMRTPVTVPLAGMSDQNGAAVTAASTSPSTTPLAAVEGEEYIAMTIPHFYSADEEDVGNEETAGEGRSRGLNEMLHSLSSEI
jgi:hypothetical protein